jgi:hypothetical protein
MSGLPQGTSLVEVVMPVNDVVTNPLLYGYSYNEFSHHGILKMYAFMKSEHLNIN